MPDAPKVRIPASFAVLTAFWLKRDAVFDPELEQVFAGAECVLERLLIDLAIETGNPYELKRPLSDLDRQIKAVVDSTPGLNSGAIGRKLVPERTGEDVRQRFVRGMPLQVEGYHSRGRGPESGYFPPGVCEGV